MQPSTNKKAAAGKLELANVSGVPPSFYFIFTLRSQQVEGLVQLQPGDTPPSTPRDLRLRAKKERRLSDDKRLKRGLWRRQVLRWHVWR